MLEYHSRFVKTFREVLREIGAGKGGMFEEFWISIWVELCNA